MNTSRTSHGGLTRAWWPEAQWSDAITELVFRSGLPARAGRATQCPPDYDDGGLRRWLCHAARSVGIAGTLDSVNVEALDQALEPGGVYLIVVPGRENESPRALALSKTGGRSLRLMHPDGSEDSLRSTELVELLLTNVERVSPLAELFAGLPGGKRALTRLSLVRGSAAAPLLVVRYAPDGTQPFLTQLRHAGVVGKLLGYVAVTGAHGVASALGAFTLGSAALTGIVDVSRIVAWSLLLLSSVPLHYLGSLWLGAIAIEVGMIVKKRLLEGALNIGETHLKSQGFGVVLARLNEASVVEQTSVAEIFSLLTTFAQLAAAVALLWLGALAVVQVSLWGVFAFGALAIGVLYFRAHRKCYRLRTNLTEDLVEKTVGHRTRAVQANPEHLHDEEDAALQTYAKETRVLDRLNALMAVYGRLWLCASGIGLLFAFTLGSNARQLLPTAVGVFLGYTSFAALLGAARGVATWTCAWQGVRSLFAAGAANDATPIPAEAGSDSGQSTLVSSVSFGYRAREVFSDVNLRIERGERVLVGGPSGGGKTTLSKLLTGELRATSGTILVNGVDAASVPEAAWRQRVVSSPQFHENYVFTNTFGFNVDPKGAPGELSSAARAVCLELGLRELLGKMPSRAAQLLGETGWQLSHGERSRVFIARSLLQGAELLIFDESFAALDPESLALALRCVRARAETLLVIAHQ